MRLRVHTAVHSSPETPGTPPQWRTEAWEVGFVGRTQRGPLGTLVTVASVADYARVFGSFEPAGPMDAAVAAFFAQGGDRCRVLRVVGGLGGQASSPEGAAGASAELARGRAEMGAGLLVVEASSPGVWARGLRCTARIASLGPPGVLLRPARQGERRLCVHGLGGVAPGTVVRVERPGAPGQLLTVEAQRGQALEVREALPWDCAPRDPTVVEPVGLLVEVSLGGEVERIGPASVAGPPAGRLDRSAARHSAWVRLRLAPDALSGPVAALRALDGAAVRLEVQAAGPLDEELARRVDTWRETLLEAEDLAVLCAPDTALEHDEATARAALACLGGIASARRDCFALLDLPAGWSPADVTRWRESATWGHAVAVYPPLRDERGRAAPASGALAAALSDAIRRGAPLRRPWGSWLHGVVDTSVHLDRAARAALLDAGVCVVTGRPARGLRADGSATLGGPGQPSTLAAASVEHAVVRHVRARLRAALFDSATPSAIARLESRLASDMAALARRGCFRERHAWDVACSLDGPDRVTARVAFAPVDSLWRIEVCLEEGTRRRVEQESNA